VIAQLGSHHGTCVARTVRLKHTVGNMSEQLRHGYALVSSARVFCARRRAFAAFDRGSGTWTCGTDAPAPDLSVSLPRHHLITGTRRIVEIERAYSDREITALSEPCSRVSP
jgi:hypothetical protein